MNFAPQLFIPNHSFDISFYEKALGAVELRRFSNDDGSVHVAEFSLGEMIFHLHEQKPAAGQLSPLTANGITTLIGLFVENVDAFIEKAITAGALLISPAQSYDYGYRQAQIKDPFGHVWLIEQKI